MKIYDTHFIEKIAKKGKKTLLFSPQNRNLIGNLFSNYLMKIREPLIHPQRNSQLPLLVTILGIINCFNSIIFDDSPHLIKQQEEI